MLRRPRAGPASTARACRLQHFAAVPRARAGIRGARRAPSAECCDLREEVRLIYGLGDVVARALAHAPDLVGLLALARAQDHGNVLGGLVARERARGLE